MNDYLTWKNFKTVCALNLRNTVRAISTTSSAPCIAAIAAGTKIYNYKDTLELRQMTSGGKLSEFICLAYRQDDQLLYSGTANGTVLAMQHNKVLRSIQAHKGSVYQVQPLSQVTSFVSSGADNAVIQWDLPTGEAVHTFIDSDEFSRNESTSGNIADSLSQPVKSLCSSRMSPHLFYAGSASGVVKLFDTRKQESVRQWEHNYPISALVLSHNESSLYAAGDTWIRGWSIISASLSSANSQFCLYQRHNQLVTGLQITAEDDYLLSCGLDGLVRICRTLDCAPVHGWELDSGIVSMSLFSPECSNPVSVADEEVIKKKSKLLRLPAGRHRLWLGCDDGTVQLKVHDMPKKFLPPSLTQSSSHELDGSTPMEEQETRTFTNREMKRLLAIERSLKLGRITPQQLASEEDVVIEPMQAPPPARLPIDRYLRKFQHSAALKHSLGLCVDATGRVRKSILPRVARVLEELHRRDVLPTAILLLEDPAKKKLHLLIRRCFHMPAYTSALAAAAACLPEFGDRDDLEVLENVLRLCRTNLPSLS